MMITSAARSVVIETVANQLGYNLKTEQRAIITSFVKGEDVFGIRQQDLANLFATPSCPSFLTEWQVVGIVSLL